MNQKPAGNNIELTHEEVGKLKRAMKKPEFMGMLSDYMTEISDPKNKDEYDQYLRQLEKDGELPKGLKIHQPEPEFCIKTTLTTKKDKSQEQKLFINCCSLDVIGRPTFNWVEKNGARGQNWNIPYSANKIRYDQDVKKTVCNTLECVFHPYTYELCSKNSHFRQLVCSTALEAAKKQLGERNEEISQDYKILKKSKSKGGRPALILIRHYGKPTDHTKVAEQQSEMDKRQTGEGYETKLYKDIMNQKEEYNQDKKKLEEDKKQNDDNEDVEIKEENIDEKETNETGSKPVKAPKYKFIYSYPIEYSDFLDNRKQNTKRPNTIGVDISLPGVKNVNDMKLDINEKNLILDIPGKYYLDIQLPYHVLQDKGSAKFESKKKVLKIKLPVDKEKLPKNSEFEENNNNLQPENVNEDVDQQNKENNSQNQSSSQKPEEDKLLNEQTQDIKNEQLQQKTQNNQNSEQMLEIGQGESSLQIIKQETNQGFLQEYTNLEGEKNLIQEIQSNDQKQQENGNTEIDQGLKIEKGKKIKKQVLQQLDFKQQETQTTAFIIINITDYSKPCVEYLIFDKQILVRYIDEYRTLFLRVEVEKPIDNNKSNISLVTDYIVVNLIKLEPQFWEGKYIIKKDDTYEDFQITFNEIYQAKKLFEKDNQQELQICEKKTQQIDELEEKEEQKESNQINDTQGQKDKEIKQENEQQNDNKIESVSKSTLQFIQFNAPFAYEID